MAVGVGLDELADRPFALGEKAGNPSFNETNHRRGCRLIVPSEAPVSDEAVVSRAAGIPLSEIVFSQGWISDREQRSGD